MASDYPIEAQKTPWKRIIACDSFRPIIQRHSNSHPKKVPFRHTIFKCFQIHWANPLSKTQISIGHVISSPPLQMGAPNNVETMWEQFVWEQPHTHTAQGCKHAPCTHAQFARASINPHHTSVMEHATLPSPFLSRHEQCPTSHATAGCLTPPIQLKKRACVDTNVCYAVGNRQHSAQTRDPCMPLGPLHPKHPNTPSVLGPLHPPLLVLPSCTPPPVQPRAPRMIPGKHPEREREEEADSTFNSPGRR